MKHNLMHQLKTSLLWLLVLRELKSAYIVNWGLYGCEIPRVEDFREKGGNPDFKTLVLPPFCAI